jgi:hypothetical protein
MSTLHRLILIVAVVALPYSICPAEAGLGGLLRIGKATIGKATIVNRATRAAKAARLAHGGYEIRLINNKTDYFEGDTAVLLIKSKRRSIARVARASQPKSVNVVLKRQDRPYLTRRIQLDGSGDGIAVLNNLLAGQYEATVLRSEAEPILIQRRQINEHTCCILRGSTTIDASSRSLDIWPMIDADTSPDLPQVPRNDDDAPAILDEPENHTAPVLSLPDEKIDEFANDFMNAEFENRHHSVTVIRPSDHPSRVSLSPYFRLKSPTTLVAHLEVLRQVDNACVSVASSIDAPRKKIFYGSLESGDIIHIPVSQQLSWLDIEVNDASWESHATVQVPGNLEVHINSPGRVRPRDVASVTIRCSSEESGIAGTNVFVVVKELRRERPFGNKRRSVPDAVGHRGCLSPREVTTERALFARPVQLVDGVAVFKIEAPNRPTEYSIDVIATQQSEWSSDTAMIQIGNRGPIYRAHRVPRPSR